MFWVRLSILGLGLIGMPIAALAQAGLPSGYTRSRTAIPGQHCYHSGGDRTYFYCYPRAIETYRTQASPSPSGSMMAPGGSMMRPNPSSSGSMMAPHSPSGSMMRPAPSPTP